MRKFLRTFLDHNRPLEYFTPAGEFVRGLASSGQVPGSFRQFSSSGFLEGALIHQKPFSSPLHENEKEIPSGRPNCRYQAFDRNSDTKFMQKIIAFDWVDHSSEIISLKLKLGIEFNSSRRRDRLWALTVRQFVRSTIRQSQTTDLCIGEPLRAIRKCNIFCFFFQNKQNYLIQLYPFADKIGKLSSANILPPMKHERLFIETETSLTRTSVVTLQLLLSGLSESVRRENCEESRIKA